MSMLRALESSIDSLWQTLHDSLRLADVLDIALVAMAIHTVMRWFRTARSRFVMLGLATLGALYFAARVLEMRLTLFFFQAGIAVALVALVVIFQEDIRRGFERLATGGLLRAQAPPSLMLDAVVDAIAQLAQKRVGALLVFKGHEPLERHLTGGVRLDGRLSEALLTSIFDPHSAGHDGAVIVDQGRVRHFAVHLPLSAQPNQEARRGTRHSAALGLSERSDALVVVVSEERGTISVAQAGVLEPVDAAALRTRLQAFLQLGGAPSQAPRHGRSLSLKVLSLVIACFAWLVLFGQQRETVVRTYSVPIVYQDVPEGWLVEEPRPLEARVTLSGPSSRFRDLQTDALSVVLDLGAVQRGAQILSLHTQDLTGSEQLQVQSVEPRTVRVVAHPTVELTLPVKPRLKGRLDPSLRLLGTRAEPAEVLLRVRADWRHRYARVMTVPIDLSELEDTSSLPARLMIPEGATLADPEAPASVQVTVELEPKARTDSARSESWPPKPSQPDEELPPGGLTPPAGPAAEALAPGP